jgi:hypothetical protein
MCAVLIVPVTEGSGPPSMCDTRCRLPIRAMISMTKTKLGRIPSELFCGMMFPRGSRAVL